MAAILPAQLLTKTGLKATKEVLASKRAVALYFSGEFGKIQQPEMLISVCSIIIRPTTELEAICSQRGGKRKRLYAV